MNKLNLKYPSLVLINGRQGSGKSWLLSYIMREAYVKNEFDYGIVFSNTLFEGTFQYIPKKYRYDDFDEDKVKSLMALQKKHNNKRAFIIFDDCLDDENQWNNQTIKKLTTQLRHYNISMIITTQYPHMIPPRIRANAMYSMFLDVGSGIRELGAIYQCYGNRFPSFQEFKQFYFENIKNHQFIMWNKDKQEYSVYRAPENIPHFKLKYNRKQK